MTKILVLGGGPAGYVAAGRAAQLGAEVTVVEAREIGGTCLNRGCIPTKAMVAGAARLHDARGAAEYGVLVGDVGLDFAAFMARKDAVTTQLRDGVAHLLKARKVQVVAGRATLAGPGRLALAPGAILADGTVLEEGGELEGDAVILASGSEPVRMGLFDWSDPRMMTSDELLRIESVPETLAIVGGGVIGCEFASVFSRLGCEVTVVEMLDQLLPGEDQRVGRTLQQAFKKAGIAVHVKTAVEAAEAGAKRRRDAAPRRRRRDHRRARARRGRAAAAERRPRLRGGRRGDRPRRLRRHRRELPHDPRRRLRGGRRGGPAAPRALGLPPGRHRRRERRDRLEPALRPDARPELRVQLAGGGELRRHRGQGQGRGHRARGRARALQRQLQGGLRRRRRRLRARGLRAGRRPRARRQPDRAARHRARPRARAGGSSGPDAGRHRRHHPRPPDALRGGRRGRARPASGRGVHSL